MRFLTSTAFVACLLTMSVAKPTNYTANSTVAKETKTLDELYADAQTESGTLRVSWGGDEPGGNGTIVDAFTARFPNIKISVITDLSKYHDSRADRSYLTTGSEDADIAVLQTVHDFRRWKKEGRLLPFKPAQWDEIYTEFKDADAAYLSPFIYSFGTIVYNAVKLGNTSIPTKYTGFLAPEWKNKLTIAYPNDDDAVAYLFYVIIKTHGWSWFEDLAKQNVTWVRGTATPVTLLSSNSTGDLSVSFSTYPLGDATAMSQQPEDRYMSWPQTGAIFKSTKMPKTSKLFMSFLVSDEYQNSMVSGGIAVTRNDIKDAPSPFGNAYAEPLGFVEWMENREEVEWYKLQFETTIGTAQGLSPLVNGI